MKYKQIFLTFLIVLVAGAFTSSSTVRADNEVCADIIEGLGVVGEFLGGSDSCGDGDVVSFSGFEGSGLQAPSGEGLDESLTQATNAREFILKVVNFALGFLALIAVVVIIYGGFLYVTAAGNEENSGKGKKAVTYAVIGILIILGSYAIVNTVANALIGEEGGSTRGSATTGIEGSNITQQSVYNLGAVEVNTSLGEFIAAYRKIVEIRSLVKRIPTIAGPRDRGENRSYLNEIGNVVSSIKSKAGALTETQRVAQKFIDEYLFPLQDQPDETLKDEKFEVDQDLTEKFNDDSGGSGSSKLKNEVVTNLTSASSKYNLEEAMKKDYEKAIDALIGPAGTPSGRPTGERVEGRLRIVWKAMGKVAEDLDVANAGDEAFKQGLVTESQLKRVLSGIDPNVKVGQLFQEAIEALDAARGIKNEPDDQNDLVVNAVKALDRLYIIIKDIKFVYVRINASTNQGSAPFTVELSGLGSRDPSNATIPDAQYDWDPDGNGTSGVQGGNVDCGTGDVKRPTIICTYKKTGTYRVRLRIESQNPRYVAPGETIFSVTVTPPLSRIDLQAKIGDASKPIPLREYVDDQPRDKQELPITTEEAKNGVIFDASRSKGSDGSSGANLKKEWNFGDGTPVENNTDSVKHTYKKEGTYPLTLEVTDLSSREDRKITKIIVGPLAARFEVSKSSGEPDELFEFDGSISRSDHGPIKSYTWSVIDTNSNTDIISSTQKLTVVGSPDTSVLRARFKNPGSYVVKLEISDGSQSMQTPDGEEIKIKSRKPRANLAVHICPEDCPDPSKPALVEFDASGSTDPDKGDELTYNWKFLNEIGEELTHPTSITIENNPQLPSKTAQKMRVHFKNPGQYRVVLTVNDSHEGDIQQEDIKEKSFEITSIVEAILTSSTKPVAKLNEQKEAEITLIGSTRYADSLEVDFGDNEVRSIPIDPDESGATPFMLTKKYTTAGTYLVKIDAVSDNNKGTTSLRRYVYIAEGDSPLAVIEVSINGQPVILTDGSAPEITVTRNQRLAFNGSQSINSTGTTAGLRYSWDFDDGTTSTRDKEDHRFAETSAEGAPFIVELTVSEGSFDPRELEKCASTPGACPVGGNLRVHKSQFRVNVVNKKPTVATLSLEKKSAGQTTPVEVLLTAEGAADEDGGRITTYQFWYFDPTDREGKRAVVESSSDRATLTVETEGEEGEEKEYLFCVSVTDNTNLTSECEELFDDSELPHLTVINGPNKAPIAEFTVDDTSVIAGDTVTFSSSSEDPDEEGEIVEYIWDVEGDGYSNDKPTSLASITYTYEKKSPPGGYRTKLKVVDDKGAYGYSKEIPVRVDPKSNRPTALFDEFADGGVPRRVRFIDRSTSDTANGATLAKWTWDFDTAQEFGCGDPTAKAENCNHNKTDDIDSEDQNPIFDFPTDHDIYQVQLTVEDSDENTHSWKKLINIPTLVSSGSGSRPVGTPPAPAQVVLRADLQTPSLSLESIPGCTPAYTPQCKRKVLLMPTADSQLVTLRWGGSRGADIARTVIDLNTRCDSDGNGNQSDDADIESTAEGTRCSLGAPLGQVRQECTVSYPRLARTNHAKGVGYFTTQLKIGDNVDFRDPDTTISTDEIEIAFERPAGQTTEQREREHTAMRSQSHRCVGLPQRYLLSGGGSLFTGLGSVKTIAIGLATGLAIGFLGFGINSFVQRRRNKI